MPQLKEILDIEKSRNGDNTTIHLFAEGLFYRAYEWSAWLCCRYVSEFKATRREMKGGGTMVFIGFPVKSLAKFVPTGVPVEERDGSVRLLLPLESHPELAGNSADTDFGNWKNSVPLTAPAKKNENLRDELKNNTDNEPRRMSEIMLTLLDFPIEQKTPFECMTFLSELKRRIAALL